MDLNNLIDFFPSYFKENDTYKVNGKGLLERFLDICGEYFQQYPVADLDAYLENLEVNKTNIIFIQNFWKFFGELPFVGGPNIDAEQFIKDFTGFNFDEALEKAIRSSKPFDGAGDIDYRGILRHAVSLFKIRGTKKFFEVMFRLYGITCTIGEDTDSNPFETDFITKFDEEYTIFDKATFDHYYRCKECIQVKFTFNKAGATLSFANQMKSFVERFIPFYITPVIEVSGLGNLYGVKIEVTPVGPLDIAPEESTQLTVKVTPTIEGNTTPSLAYQVAVTEIGTAPKEEDWSSGIMNEIYPVLAGNKDYHFRPVEDKTQVKKVTVNEVYSEFQYMIWKVSPTTKEDLTLTTEKKEISLVINAVKYTYHYKNGKIDGAVEAKPADFIWDNAPEGEESNYTGQSTIKVTRAREQIFSIADLRSRKLRVTIYIDQAYQDELNSIVLNLKPKYLLIKGVNTRDPNPSWGDLSEGTYGSDDGSNWTPHDIQTEFEVVDMDGNPIEDAVITETSNINKKYKPGDIFIPSVQYNGATYRFKATYNGVESEIAVLTIYNDTTEAVNATPTSIQVNPESLTLEYNPGLKETRTFQGEARFRGIPSGSAKTQAPVIVMKNQKTGEELTTYGLYKEYLTSGIAVYTFEFTAELEGPDNLTLRFYPEGNESVRQDVPINFVQSEFYIYIKPQGNLDQWEVNQTISAADEDFKEGTELTFTAQKEWKTARWRFDGSYGGEITDANGKIYEKNVDYSVEVTEDKDLVFTAGSQTITIHLKDFPPIVELNISPTEATQESPGEYVSTKVWGSTNKSDKFEYTVDGIPFSLANNEVGEYSTKESGPHVFVAKDDPTKTATFVVKGYLLPTGISIDPASATMDIGQTKDINAVVTPPDSNYEPLQWQSSNPGVCSVTGLGTTKAKIQAIAEGTAVITVSTPDGMIGSCEVKVNGAPQATGISISPSSQTLDIGGTVELTASITPNTVTDTVTWQSSSPTLASVIGLGGMKAKVTALGAGSITITATTSNGQTATCDITVNPPVELEHTVANDIESYTWTASPANNSEEYGSNRISTGTVGERFENNFRVKGKAERLSLSLLSAEIADINQGKSEYKSPVGTNQGPNGYYYYVSFTPTHAGVYKVYIYYAGEKILENTVTVS